MDKLVEGVGILTGFLGGLAGITSIIINLYKSISKLKILEIEIMRNKTKRKELIDLEIKLKVKNKGNKPLFLDRINYDIGGMLISLPAEDSMEPFQIKTIKKNLYLQEKKFKDGKDIYIKTIITHSFGKSSKILKGKINYGYLSDSKRFYKQKVKS